jgi:hypothetical protein
MHKKIIVACLLVCSVVQISRAFDPNTIEIQINDQLPGNTVYAQPYSGFDVAMMRKSGIETLRMTLVNNGSDVITISPSCITNIEPVSEKVAEDGLLGLPRKVNLIVGSISLLLILAWVAMYKFDLLSGAPRKVAHALFGLSVLGLPGSYVSGKIEDYIWVQIADNSLCKSVTIAPGQTVQKFVFVDKNKMLPHTYTCRITDAQGQEHSIDARKVSAR